MYVQTFNISLKLEKQTFTLLFLSTCLTPTYLFEGPKWILTASDNAGQRNVPSTTFMENSAISDVPRFYPEIKTDHANLYVSIWSPHTWIPTYIGQLSKRKIVKRKFFVCQNSQTTCNFILCQHPLHALINHSSFPRPYRLCRDS